ncbi:hypothetical protein ACJX0J_007428, partial [Zea mays]
LSQEMSLRAMYMLLDQICENLIQIILQFALIHSRCYILIWDHLQQCFIGRMLEKTTIAVLYFIKFHQKIGGKKKAQALLLEQKILFSPKLSIILGNIGLAQPIFLDTIGKGPDLGRMEELVKDVHWFSLSWVYTIYPNLFLSILQAHKNTFITLHQGIYYNYHNLMREQQE